MAYLSTSKNTLASEALPSRDKDERAIEKVSLVVCSFLFPRISLFPIPS
ncbi:hypothetical protein GBAR_LOCUS12140, partial [Geodia barretti]